VDRIIITSDEARYSHLASGTMTARQVVTIPQAIDPTPFLQTDPGAAAALRQRLDLAPGRQVVGMVGRMYEQKGHRYLLDAWPAVHVAQPEAVLALVGDGPLRAELEAQAARLGISDSVRFLGTRTDLPALLDLCALVVLPSLFEGFPLIVLEAMAAGRPVVGTRVCGASEAIVDGETGRLVPPADPDALATAIVRLLRTPVKARRMGQAGRLRAVRDFDIRRMAAQTHRVYQTLLEEKTQPRLNLDAVSAAAYVVL
jgi:glycosyltransferase involved in cell wall biosynthesis